MYDIITYILLMFKWEGVMIPNCYEVSPRLTVRACQTTKLKAGMISLSVVNPISKEDAYLTSLLLSVLKRGTEKYPTQKHINERLDALYATLVNLKNQKFDLDFL